MADTGLGRQLSELIGAVGLFLGDPRTDKIGDQVRLRRAMERAMHSGAFKQYMEHEIFETGAMTPEDRARKVISLGGQLLLPFNAGDSQVTYSSRRRLAELIAEQIREAVSAGEQETDYTRDPANQPENIR